MAKRHVSIATRFIFFLFMFSIALAKEQGYPARGSSVSTEDDTTTILVSPNGAFSCGFYKVATNAFTFSIWFSWSSAKTVAWSANRDAPVNGKGSRLKFHMDGSLQLHDYNGTAVWSTNTTSTPANRAMLLDSGNLVVVNPDGSPLCTSFASPTDTLLPGQPMTRNTKLVCASAKGLPYSGLYTFYFDTDNILRLIYNGPQVSSIYFPNPDYISWRNQRSTYNNSQYGVLYEDGRFVSSDKLEFQASDLNQKGVMRRLTLDYDGNLRLYSLNAASGKWSISWIAFIRLCEIHGLCGVNSICTYKLGFQSCSCLEGFEMTEPGDWSKGCRPKININGNKDFSFRKLQGIDSWGYDINYTSSIPLRKCKKMCLENGNCQAFGYQQGLGACFIKGLLINGKNSKTPYLDMYLKLPKEVTSSHEPIHACRITEITYPSAHISNGPFGYFLTSALTLLVIEVALIIAGCWIVYKRERRPEIKDQGYTIISSQFRRFSYKELQKATKCFHEELGNG